MNALAELKYESGPMVFPDGPFSLPLPLNGRVSEWHYRMMPCSIHPPHVRFHLGGVFL